MWNISTCELYPLKSKDEDSCWTLLDIKSDIYILKQAFEYELQYIFISIWNIYNVFFLFQSLLKEVYEKALYEKLTTKGSKIRFSKLHLQQL